MSWYRTTLGKKVVVGVTGVILLLYVFFHLLGNLQIYLGRESINGYAALLHARGELLWVARIVLIAAFVTHIVGSVQLALHNRQARGPSRYRVTDYRTADYASRTMIWSGPIVAAFIVFHILHLTLGAVGPSFDHAQHDVYAGVVAGFSVWSVSLFYIVANALLGLHLFHGAWSLFQTLGLNHPRYNHWRRRLATAFALFVAVGNVSIPVAVMTGVVG